MVGGALQSKIEGDLDAKLIGLLNQRIKVLQGAQIRVDGVVATGSGPDSPRAADVVGLRGQRIVAALAVNLANGVDGREVHGVKTHACCALKLTCCRLEGPVNRVTLIVPPTGRAREELIPAAHQRLRALHRNLVGFPAGQKIANRVQLQKLEDVAAETRSDTCAQFFVLAA